MAIDEPDNQKLTKEPITSIEAIFNESIEEFTSLLINNTPEDQPSVLNLFTYAATRCGGGGEIALYTMIAGLFRKKLEIIDNQLRLGIDLHVRNYGKPDIMVHQNNNSNCPVFLAEFKILYDSGLSNSHPNQVLNRIDTDLEQLRDFMHLKMQTNNQIKPKVSMVVFNWSSGGKSDNEVAFSNKGLRKMMSFKLWCPSTITDSGWFHIYIANSESISNYNQSDTLEGR